MKKLWAKVKMWIILKLGGYTEQRKELKPVFGWGGIDPVEMIYVCTVSEGKTETELSRGVRELLIQIVEQGMIQINKTYDPVRDEISYRFRAMMIDPVDIERMKGAR